LIKDLLKKKILTKGIKSYIDSKNKFNLSNGIAGTFGVVLFQDVSNPINIYDKPDSESIISAIDECWDSREVNQSYFENGLFEILAYIFNKIREKPMIHRVIIVSDEPSKLSEDYYNALYDLIVKAKTLSNIFIDIIRMGEKRFYDDDIKLKVITSETRGGAFYCNDSNHFLSILGSLVKNKEEMNVIKGDEEKSQVLEKDKTFYERMAVELITLSSEDENVCAICGQELCPICGAISDEIKKCFNCVTKFHNCCASKYSIANNIGFIHIFHCPKCDSLLKLDEDLVKTIYKEEQEEASQEIDLSKFVSEKRPARKAEDQEQVPSSESIELEEPESIESSIKLTKVRVGGYFGRDVMVAANSLKIKKAPENSGPEIKVAEVDIKEKVHEAEKEIIREEKVYIEKEKLSITTLKPPRKTTIKLCKICGNSCSYLSASCPNCGARLE
jgi:hypothetical protein